MRSSLPSRRTALGAVGVFAVLALAAFAAGPAPARPRAAACTNLIRGTSLPETLTGTAGRDRILALGGDDRLLGGAGNDCLYGGYDSDELSGGPGSDLLAGGPGDDVLDGGPGNDVIAGGRDRDRITGASGNDTLKGGGGGDVLRGGPGRDTLLGQHGNDRIYGGAGRDRIDGGSGRDDIREVPDAYATDDPVDTGRNHIHAGAGGDRVNVANGRRDTVDCGPGRDTVFADKADRLRGCERRHDLISPFPAVTPSRGGRTRAFMIRFRALDTLGRDGDYFSISVAGPRGRGCGKLVTNSVGVTYHRDRAVRFRLQPFRSGGHRAKRWCRGRYGGSVSFVHPFAGCSVTPSKAPSPKCSQEVRIGRFSFRVRG